MTASNGCDSVVTLDLTINTPLSSSDVITSCGSYTWIDGNTYTTSNTTATTTLTASNGCDSVVTLNLTINSPLNATETASACDYFTWINGITYTSNNNTDSVVLIGSNGCDSILYLNLTILPSKTYVDSVEACNSYTWINAITYLSDNSSAAVTYTAQNGCDSVIYLNLTISNVNTIIQTSGDTLMASPNQMSYQWLICESGTYTPISNAVLNTFIPISSGHYAVRIVNGTCVDTSSCIFFSGLGVTENTSIYKIYPNPANGFLKIESKLPINTIRVYDSSGRKVFDAMTDQPSSDILLDLKGLKSGLYSIQLISDYWVQSETLIISY